LLKKCVEGRLSLKWITIIYLRTMVENTIINRPLITHLAYHRYPNKSHYVGMRSVGDLDPVCGFYEVNHGY